MNYYFLVNSCINCWIYIVYCNYQSSNSLAINGFAIKSCIVIIICNSYSYSVLVIVSISVTKSK